MEWIIPDTHGCKKTLEILIEQKIQLTKTDKIYFLGDYIDRGPDSKGVIDYIMNLENEGYNVTCLKGNHEEYMVWSYNEQLQKKNRFFKSKNKSLQEWLMHGGKETLDSFGAKIPTDIPKKYIEWINKLKYYVELDTCILVHAGLNFENESVYEDKYTMLWAKEFDIVPEKISHKKIIHGHTPLSINFIKESIENHQYDFIALDNGCVYKEKPNMGNLIAYEILSNKIEIQPNIDML